MKANEFFPSLYIRALDLNGQVRRVAIDTVTVEELRDGGKKPVLWFKNADRGLVLNKTNNDVLIQAFGAETDDWKAKRIELFTVRVQHPNGGMVDGIRVRALASAPPAKPEEAPSKPVSAGNDGDDFNDDIPF